MDPQFALLFDQVQDISTVLLLCWTRIYIVFGVVPLFGSGTLPLLARAAITVALSMLLYPLVAAEVAASPPSGTFWLATLMLKEGFLGLLIGHTVAMLLWGVSGIGFFIDNQRGASLAAIVNPLIGDQTSPLGMFLLQVLVTLLFVTGGMNAFVAGLYASYSLWPVTAFFPVLDIDKAVWFLGQFDQMMHVILFLGGPIIALMFVAEFGLALVGRFAPQLNVFFLAMPIKSGIAMLVFALYLGALMAYFREDLDALRYIPARLDDLLR